MILRLNAITSLHQFILDYLWKTENVVKFVDSISRDDVMLYADAQIYILIREGSIKIFGGFNKQDIGKNGAE